MVDQLSDQQISMGVFMAANANWKGWLKMNLWEYTHLLLLTILESGGTILRSSNIALKTYEVLA